MSCCDLRNHDRADYEHKQAAALLGEWRANIQQVLDHAPGKLKGSKLEAACRSGRDGGEAHVTIVKKRILGGLGLGKFKEVGRVWMERNGFHDASIHIFDKRDNTMTWFKGDLRDKEEMQRKLLERLERDKKKLFGLSR